MARADDNLYLLLGLYDPDNNLVGTSDNDPTIKSAIDSAVRKKQVEWSADSRNPKKQAKANDNLDKAKKAAASLSTMDQRRSAWSEAKTLVEQAISGCIKTFGGMKGYLLDAEVANIPDAVEKKIGYKPTRKQVEALIPGGMEVRKGSGGAAGKDLPKPAKYSTYNGQEPTLATYGYSSLYDLLGGAKPRNVGGRDVGGRNITKIKATPTAQWRKWADEDKKKLPNKSTTEVGDHNKLYQLCLQTFASDTSRAQYDEYLIYHLMMGVLDEMKQACSVSHQLDAGAGEQYANRLMEIGSKNGKPVSHDDAIAYITGACAKAKPPIMYAAPTGSASRTQVEFCPWCGAIIDLKAVACPTCGGKIRITCPQCGTENRADVKFCPTCSKSYEDMRTATALCDEAKSQVTALRFDEATQLLDQAEALWKSLSDIPTVRADIARQQALAGPLAGQLNDAMKKRQFVAAKKLCEDLKRRVPQFDDSQVREPIESGITAAKKIMDAAGANPTVADALSAYELCADYPGIAQILAANPPQPVASVQARADGARRYAVLNWSASSTQSATYVVIRKEESRPLDVSDGVELMRTMGTSYTDATIEANTQYFYAVATTIGPQVSALTVSDPVTALFDVKDIAVTPEESAISATWSGVPRSATVEVWRKERQAPGQPGEGDRVSNVITTGFKDTGLENGVEYYYTIFVAYTDATGKKVYSHGVSCSGVPVAEVEPIAFILPRLMPDNTFTLEWDAPQEGKAEFFYTKQKPDIKTDDKMPLADLEARANRLTVSETGDGKGTFSLPDDSIYYVVSATVISGTAVIGAMATVTSRKAVTIDKITATGSDAFLMFSWPQECDRVLLLWRTDRYPASPDEGGASHKVITRKVYDLRQGIAVEGLSRDKTYYFALFAQLGTGDSASYSAGSMKSFAFSKSGKVTYHVNAHTLFGKVLSAKLVVESNCPVPACELRVAKSFTPLRQSDGVQVISLPDQTEAGTHEFSLPTASLGADIHYTLFFQDKDNYNRIDLGLKPGVRPEIGK